MMSQQIGDLISREETLTAFSDYVAGGMSMDDFKALWDIVTKMPPANPWIPVSERLPEKSGRYLAYIVNEYDNELQYSMTCEYFTDGPFHWFPDDECASDNVIAWMPLPEPYKAESEDE